MTVKYRTAGAWGTGEGHDLTAAEVDGNFWDHEGRIQTLETATAAGPKSIVSTTSSSTGVLTIHYSDGTTDTVTFATTSPPPPVLSTPVAGTTYTLAAADRNSYLRASNASGCAITIPANADVAIEIGSEFHFRATTTGHLTFTAASGVTLNIPSTFAAETDKQHATVTLKKVATDEWDLFGLLKAA